MEFPIKPAIVGILTGVIDGVIDQKRHNSLSNHGVDERIGPVSWLNAYRGVVLLLGAGLTAFTDWEPEITTALLVSGSFGVSTALGSRLVANGQPTAGTAGYVEDSGTWDGADDDAGAMQIGYVTADGRFIQGGPDPSQAPAMRVPFIARGLITPPESLAGYS